jgi:hypothetical protein
MHDWVICHNVCTAVLCFHRVQQTCRGSAPRDGQLLLLQAWQQLVACSCILGMHHASMRNGDLQCGHASWCAAARAKHEAAS